MTTQEANQASTSPLIDPADRMPAQAELRLDSLTRTQIIGYGVGHFLNDLAGACWFNYLLYFLKNIVFSTYTNSGFYAGLVLLSGQIADGIATPIVGYYSDKVNTRIGQRTPWYIFGTLTVTICFLFLFQKCLLCEWFDNDGTAMMTFYYVFFPSLSNVGWAATQVSHMSLVPSLTLSRKQRDTLNTLRNTFSYIANVYVLIVAFIIFLVVKGAYYQFTLLGFLSVGLGFMTSMFFLFTVNEKKLVNDCQQLKKRLKEMKKAEIESGKKLGALAASENSVLFEREEVSPQEILQKIEKEDLSPILEDEQNVKESQADFTWRHWFSIPAFYIYGVVYMGSRVLANVQSSLLIFYLQNVLGIAKGQNTFEHGVPIEFAIIPLIIYISSTITSSSLKGFYEKYGRKRAYIVGALLSVTATVAMMLLNVETKNIFYGVSIIIGVSQSICLNTGISMISEVVGVRGKNAAFVFGAYSTLEKFANGIILYAIMNVRDVSSDENETYIRVCTSIIPAIAAVVACFFVTIGKAKDYDAGDLVTEGDDNSKVN
jgi:Na+/melibiose symporter-like transporter